MEVIAYNRELCSPHTTDVHSLLLLSDYQQF